VDEALLKLRTQSYTMGRKHDQALKMCADVLLREAYDDVEDAIANHIEVAHDYGIALARLLNRLSQMEATAEVVDEISRVRRVLDLLDREVDEVKKRLELSRRP
jgi:hypothetical protein